MTTKITARPLPGTIDSAKAAELGIRLLMSVLLGRLRIFGSFAPFGVAFAAAAPEGAAGVVSLIGVCVGALSGGPVGWAVKYIAASVLIRAAIHFFAASLHRLFPLALTFGVMAVLGFVYAWDTHFEVTATCLYVVETFLAAGLVYFYDAALAPWGRERASREAHTAGVTVLLASFFMSLASFSVFNVVSIGRMAAAVAVMFVTFRGGIGPGCVFAAAMGAAMDLAQGGIPFFTMSWAFSALISGVFSRNGRLTFVLSWVAAGTVSVLWFWAWHRWLMALYENFAATVIFMLLPDRLFARIGVFLPSEAGGYGFYKAREYTRDRVELCASAFSALYDTVRDLAGDSTCEEPAVIFDRAADQVCRRCPRSNQCWQQEYAETVDVMNNLTPILESRGEAELTDLREHFLQRCGRADQLLQAINREARSFLLRRQYRARLNESRAAAFTQYGDVSAILSSLAQELGGEIAVETALERKLQKYLRGLAIQGSTAVFRLRGGRLRAEIKSQSLYLLKHDEHYLDKLSQVLGMRLCAPAETSSDKLVLLQAEPLAVRLGSACAKKSGQPVSGDRFTSFRTDEGWLYVILSDGMGSGVPAARQAKQLIDILERFLRSGVEPELTLRILSDLMLLKSDTELESATVDLLRLNMFTGDCELYKRGAAPSYIRRGHTVKCLASGALPVGLGAVRDKLSRGCVKLSLSPGTLLLMATDGAFPSKDDKPLREKLSVFEGPDMSALASSVLSLSGKEPEDDATVIALKVEERR